MNASDLIWCQNCWYFNKMIGCGQPTDASGAGYTEYKKFPHCEYGDCDKPCKPNQKGCSRFITLRKYRIKELQDKIRRICRLKDKDVWRLRYYIENI